MRIYLEINWWGVVDDLLSKSSKGHAGIRSGYSRSIAKRWYRRIAGQKMALIIPSIPSQKLAACWI